MAATLGLFASVLKNCPNRGDSSPLPMSWSKVALMNSLISEIMRCISAARSILQCWFLQSTMCQRPWVTYSKVPLWGLYASMRAVTLWLTRCEIHPSVCAQVRVTAAAPMRKVTGVHITGAGISEETGGESRNIRMVASSFLLLSCNPVFATRRVNGSYDHDAALSGVYSTEQDVLRLDLSPISVYT